MQGQKRYSISDMSTEANEDYLEKLKSVLEVNEITENLKLFQEKVHCRCMLTI